MTSRLFTSCLSRTWPVLILFVALTATSGSSQAPGRDEATGASMPAAFELAHRVARALYPELRDRGLLTRFGAGLYLFDRPLPSDKGVEFSFSVETPALDRKDHRAAVVGQPPLPPFVPPPPSRTVLVGEVVLAPSWRLSRFRTRRLPDDVDRASEVWTTVARRPGWTRHDLAQALEAAGAQFPGSAEDRFRELVSARVRDLSSVLGPLAIESMTFEHYEDKRASSNESPRWRVGLSNAAGARYALYCEPFHGRATSLIAR